MTLSSYIKLNPFHMAQWFLLAILILVVTSTSPRSTNAQTGPETIWEEGRQVLVGGNTPDTLSIPAIPTTSPGTHYRTNSGTAFQPSASTMTFAPIVIDNTTTTYRLRVAPGVASSAHLLHGARVGFTIPTTYLPFLER